MYEKALHIIDKLWNQPSCQPTVYIFNGTLLKKTEIWSIARKLLQMMGKTY